jgi:NAD(P)-dependent dehydrogenase (short-subunit alcohol dehydrogenase family)
VKTVVITGGTDGIGRALAETYLSRGDRVLVVGRDRAKGEAFLAGARSVGAGERAGSISADLEIISENLRVVEQLSTLLDRLDVLVLGARYQRSARLETPDGLESNFALSYLSRFLFSHGLADLLGQAEDPVVLNFGGAGHFGAPTWDDLQQRDQYHGLGAMIHAGVLNSLLAVDVVHRYPGIRYVTCFPGSVATSFAGDYAGDLAMAAHIAQLRRSGKAPQVAVQEILPFLDPGNHERLTAVSEGTAIPLDPRASSRQDAQRLHDYTRRLLDDRSGPATTVREPVMDGEGHSAPPSLRGTATGGAQAGAGTDGRPPRPQSPSAIKEHRR